MFKFLHHFYSSAFLEETVVFWQMRWVWAKPSRPSVSSITCSMTTSFTGPFFWWCLCLPSHPGRGRSISGLLRWMLWCTWETSTAEIWYELTKNAREWADHRFLAHKKWNWILRFYCLFFRSGHMNGCIRRPSDWSSTFCLLHMKFCWRIRYRSNQKPYLEGRAVEGYMWTAT